MPTADLNAPEDVVWIARRLEDAGHAAWAVGGAVRDALVGRTPDDWDLTTSARPGQVQRLFRRTVPVGIDHGTVGVIGRAGKMYEVTTFRRDVENFGRRARVAFSDSLEEDLERRDFTINAVAWHPLSKEVRDPHGGMADLEAGLLRTVGDPSQRFSEDRLRVLRALRFAGAFGLQIDDATWAAIIASAGELGHLSAERVREELFKTLTGQLKPSATLTLYARAGVLGSLYPELELTRVPNSAAGEGSAWDEALRSTDAARPTRLKVRLAALLHRALPVAETLTNSANPRGSEPLARSDRAGGLRSAAAARAVLQRLKCSNDQIDGVTHLIAQHPDPPPPDTREPDIRRWIRRVGPEHVRDLFRLLISLERANPTAEGSERLVGLYRTVFRALKARQPLSIADLEISGTDLRALGIPTGRLYGEILRDLLERVTDDPSLNRKEILEEIVRAGLSSD